MSLEDLENLKTLDITDQRLGAGGFGSVFVCKSGDIKVAAKKLSQSEKEFDNLVRETSRLKRLEYGKHIAYTYGIVMKEENLYMVMEYSERGDLQNYLKKNETSVTYEQKILFCRGILLGLLYCHSMKVFHGDIKCSNVILGKNLEPKLTDFGLSMTVDNIEGYCKTYEGSIYWAAPELFSMKEEGNFKEFKTNPYPTDVYSLGATFCQVSFDGTTKFIDSDELEMNISLGLVCPTPKDGFLEKIVDKCCQFERNERITLDECLSMLDIVAEKELQVPTIDEKWQEIQQSIKVNSRLELPPSFILHRPAENLVVGPSNLSLLEWLCINNCIDAVKYMVQLHKHDQDQDQNQDQIKWLRRISELCKSSEITDFLQNLTQNKEFSRLRLSNLIDSNPQQFIEIFIKAGANCCSYRLLEKAIKKHYNMVVQTIINSRNHFKNWAIHGAIKFGNAEAVKIFANSGADFKEEDNYDISTPLITAIDTENIEIVKILLGFGVNVHNKHKYVRRGIIFKFQNTPLYLAALKDNREIVKLLIDAGATTDTTGNEWHLLSQSLEQQGNISMARFIHNSISKRSNPVKSSPLCTAIQNKQFDLVQTLVNDNENVDEIGLDGYAPLHWAVVVGDEETVKSLIGAGADLDIRTSSELRNLHSPAAPDYFNECTPLHIAISKGYLGIVKLLIGSGANFSAKNGLHQAIMDIAKEEKKEIEKIISEHAPINIISIRRAMKSVNLESVKEMIKKQQSNAEILSECLYIAISSGKNDLVKYLLKSGANINKEYQSKTPLEWAILGGNIQAMKTLIDAGVDINARYEYGITFLARCVMESNTEMVKFLVDKGVDANAENILGYRPIYYAKDIETAEILIKAGAAIDVKSDEGKALLISYVSDSQVDMVQFLVDKGADINISDKNGNAPIHHTKDREIIETLINLGADINAKGESGTTHLVENVYKSDIEMVRFLVDKGAGVNVRDKNGSAPIHYVHNREIMEILINAGADINAENQYRKTPLIQHVTESNAEMVQLLVDKGADVNAGDEYGNTPIHYANDKEIMEILIKAGAKINIQNKDKTALLFQNIRESNTEMVQFLVDEGVDMSIRDKDGNTPIHYANDKEIVKILINAGADINAKNKYGAILLTQCIKESNAEMIKFLVEKRADVNARDRYGNAPIHCTDDKEIMEILINAGADINAKNQYGVTHLIKYTRESNAEMVQFLLDKGADVKIKDKDGYVPILYANKREIMEILINAGADINARIQDGKTLLIQYVIKSNAEVVQLLLDKGADVNAKEKDGDMPIHYAISKEIRKILINAGADINAKDEYGKTPLFRYVSKANTKMVQCLIDEGADVNIRDKNGNAPILYANRREIMEILINACADVNAKNKYGKTPLIQHVIKSNAEIIQLLVDKGADVNAGDGDGNIPVQYANKREVMEILINAGADINVKVEDGTTPLIQNIKKSNTDIVQFLVDKGAGVNVRDKKGSAPIHYVNNREIMEILINAGADINEKDQDGETPLFQYARESNAMMVRLLVDKGANVDARNEDGNVPIHFVRDKEIAEILITASADINVKDRHEKELFDILMREQNINFNNNQYESKEVCRLLEYLRDMNKS